MDQTPDIPEADDTAPEVSRPYTVSEKAFAAVGLVGCALLAYVFADIIAGGRITAALSAAPPEEYLSDD